MLQTGVSELNFNCVHVHHDVHLLMTQCLHAFTNPTSPRVTGELLRTMCPRWELNMSSCKGHSWCLTCFLPTWNNDDKDRDNRSTWLMQTIVVTENLAEDKYFPPNRILLLTVPCSGGWGSKHHCRLWGQGGSCRRGRAQGSQRTHCWRAGGKGVTPISW